MAAYLVTRDSRSRGLLVRSRSECDLRKWGLQLRERLGFKRAAVAVARKLHHHALHTAHQWAFQEDTRQRLIPELVSVAGRSETSCRDVGDPLRALVASDTFTATECVMNLAEVAPRSPIMLRHMPTAKSTMLRVTASRKSPCTRRD